MFFSLCKIYFIFLQKKAYNLTTFSAVLIHPDITGGRCAGTIYIDQFNVCFNAEEIKYVIPLQFLQISAGGSGNRLIFFSDKNQNAISIYTSDKSILKSEVLVNNSLFNEHIKSTKKTLNKSLVGTLIFLAIIVLFFGGLYFFKDKMVSSLANQVPIEWEKKAGDKLFTTMSLQYKFIQNDSLKKVFLKISDPLFKQVEKDGYKIDLYFVKDPTINAFALPGGKVIIQTGLIENAKSWEEVMGVLGHELAHVTKRHHIRSMINSIGLFAILSAFMGDISSLAGTFANLGGNLASLSNSRSFENEADEEGWMMLQNAKINPKGMISFFETLKADHTTKMDTLINKTIDLSFLSTHPNTQQRIDNLKIKMKNDQNKYIVLPVNYNEFKDAFSNL